ncbi:hypothetical protein DPMN_102358 [Dreissena polymorpha]|uniref:Uncharacterized protein n=1 Tax=Dreissena polymorpha TaxID=45954 RepID=A0A9D4LMS2_DREPO|nr:hypothetical protein DPMN_102358 [Dreissena polymorpha]
MIGQKLKTAPPTGGHVFQWIGTTFELNQDIIKTNICTNFELCRDFIGTRLLNKFHEDGTRNVASRVFTSKYRSSIFFLKVKGLSFSITKEGGCGGVGVGTGDGLVVSSKGAPGLVMGPCIFEIDQIELVKTAILGGRGLCGRAAPRLVMGPCIVEIDRIVIREIWYQFEDNRCRNEEIIVIVIFPRSVNTYTGVRSDLTISTQEFEGKQILININTLNKFEKNRKKNTDRQTDTMPSHKLFWPMANSGQDGQTDGRQRQAWG